MQEGAGSCKKAHGFLQVSVTSVGALLTTPGLWGYRINHPPRRNLSAILSSFNDLVGRVICFIHYLAAKRLHVKEESSINGIPSLQIVPNKNSVFCSSVHK